MRHGRLGRAADVLASIGGVSPTLQGMAGVRKLACAAAWVEAHPAFGVNAFLCVLPAKARISFLAVILISAKDDRMAMVWVRIQ